MKKICSYLLIAFLYGIASFPAHAVHNVSKDRDSYPLTLKLHSTPLVGKSQTWEVPINSLDSYFSSSLGNNLSVKPFADLSIFNPYTPSCKKAYQLTYHSSDAPFSFLVDDQGNVIIEDANLLSTWTIETSGSLIFKGSNNFKTLNSKAKAFINEGLFKAVNGDHTHSTYINKGVMHFSSHQEATASLRDYESIYKDYLTNLNRTSVQNALKLSSTPLNSFMNYGVFLADNGIKFSHVNQINHGLSMLRNAHIDEASIENHKEYVLQGDFTGRIDRILNHGWLYADKIDSLLTPDEDQNKLIIQRWINHSGVFLGSDSNVIGAQEFDNGVWQDSKINNIYSLGSLLAGSYRYAKTMGSLSSESNLSILYEKLTREKIIKRFITHSKYYTPVGYINMDCCEAVNEIGPVYKAANLSNPSPDSRVNFMNKGKLNIPSYINTHKDTHQSLLNLYNTLSQTLTKLGVDQAANSNKFSIDAAPANARLGDKGFQIHGGKVKTYSTPLPPYKSSDKGFTQAPDFSSHLSEGFKAYNGPNTSILTKDFHKDETVKKTNLEFALNKSSSNIQSSRLPDNLPQGTWIPPEEALKKIPPELGKAEISDNKKGFKWSDGKKGNNVIRIQKGDPQSDFPSQKLDYVKIVKEGKVIGKNGRELKGTKEFPNPKNSPDAHIPLLEWIKWK